MSQVLHSPTTIYWRATFEPLKRELPTAYPWLLFGHPDNSPEGKELAKLWISADEQDPRLADLLPEHFVRGMVIENANLDFMMGAELGAAVSMDSFHAKVTSARLLRGDALPVFGNSALAVLVPDVTDLSWDDINEIRQDPNLCYYRDTLREIEAAAMDVAGSASASFREAILKQYAEHLHQAEQRMAGTFGDRLITTLITSMLGYVLTSQHHLGLLAAGIGFGIAEIQGRYGRARWRTVDEVVRKKAYARHTG